MPFSSVSIVDYEQVKVSLVVFVASSIAEVYLKPCQTSVIDVFCGNSKRLKAVIYFCKKAPSKIIDGVLNTLLLSNYCCHCFTVSSTALQLYISLGYGLLLSKLYKEKFEDIVGEGNNKLLTTLAHKIEEIIFNNNIENKDGLIVGYGLTISSILAFDTNKNSQIFASNAHKKLVNLMESTTKENLSTLTTQAQLFSFSLITMYAYQAEHLMLEEVEKYFETIEKKVCSNQVDMIFVPSLFIEC